MKYIKEYYGTGENNHYPKIERLLDFIKNNDAIANARKIRTLNKTTCHIILSNGKNVALLSSENDAGSEINYYIGILPIDNWNDWYYITNYDYNMVYNKVTNFLDTIWDRFEKSLCVIYEE